MARASPFDAALRDVLDRLHAASSELEGATDAGEVARRAADLALRLTGSMEAVVALEGAESHVARGPDAASDPSRENAVVVVPLSTRGRPIGELTVSRRAEYPEAERLALEVFAAQVAMALAGAQALEELRKSVERLTKVDSARQLLLKNMTNVVERERMRFVAELHDDAMQKLTAAEMHLARVEQPSGEEALEALDKVRELLDQTETSLRRLVFDVRPPALENPDGLEQSIQDRVDMLAAAGIKPRVELDLPEGLSPELRAMLFRQVAEAIGNVERHSEATEVNVSLQAVEGGVRGVIADNGRGFVVAERSNLPGHLGLLALRERALMAGGRYSIDSKPGEGTTVEFWIPVDR